MCGRITLRTKMNLLLSQFAAEMAEAPNWPARYNIAPTQDVPIIRQAGDEREFGFARWGLIPSWADDLKIGSRMINARAVTRHYHPMNVDSFARRQYTVGKSGAIFYRKHPELGDFLGVNELGSRRLADERQLARLRRRAHLGERFRFLARNDVFEKLMREHYLRGLKDGLSS